MLVAILEMATTMRKTKSGNPMSRMRTCKGVGFVTCGHPESVSRGTSMLRSSFTALRYRPEAVPRRLRSAQRRIVVRYRRAKGQAG
jgi:hypothetical protein